MSSLVKNCRSERVEDQRCALVSFGRCSTRRSEPGAFRSTSRSKSNARSLTDECDSALEEQHQRRKPALFPGPIRVL